MQNGQRVAQFCRFDGQYVLYAVYADRFDQRNNAEPNKQMKHEAAIEYFA